jgi:hypothetical protein
MRKTIPNRVRALLQKEVASRCPFCTNEDVDHFEIHHIDNNNQNNALTNLIMLCPTCHSKITKGDITNMDVIAMKNNFSRMDKGEAAMAKVINFNKEIDTAIVGDNNTVNIIKKKIQSKSKYIDGCIGFDVLKANYISYLISRYNEFKEYEVGKENMKYNVLGAQMKKKFKIGATRTLNHLPIDRFEELANAIQEKINGTKLGKINKGKGILKNYDSYNDYVKDNHRG